MKSILLRKVPNEIHKDAKIMAIKFDMTLEEYVVQTLEDKIVQTKAIENNK